MRHFPPPAAVATLAAGVVHATWAAALIARPGRPTGGPPGGLGAVGAAVTIAAVAMATNHHLATAAGAVEQASGGGHRQLPPMRPGSPPTSGRYLPTVRATHAPGCGTGEDCGGRCQCRTCLNGTDPVDHGVVLVISLRGDARPHAALRPGTWAAPALRRVRPRLRYAPPGTDPAQSRSHAAAGRSLRPFPAWLPLLPPATDRSSPPSLAIARAIRQLSAGFGSHRQ